MIQIDQRCPYYPLVPKDPLTNLEYRRELILAAQGDPDLQEQLWIMCSRDILFWINSLIWIFEPRDAAELNWVTYPFQDETILELLDCIGIRDVVVAKSRDMGASWMCLVVLAYLWQFKGRQTFLLLSRNESLVDDKGDPKELFFKLDYIIKMQPGWMLPSVRRIKLIIENQATKAALGGESTNKFAGVADRKRAILLDEYSKMDNQDVIFRGTRDVTRCRIFNFTPQGSANYAAKVAHDSRFRQIRLHWSVHPEKREGLYLVDQDGEVELIDKEFWTPNRVKQYRFCRKQPRSPHYKYRSPWYDLQCSRAVHDMEIAQELDIDFLASDYQYFDGNQLLQAIRELTRDPDYVGDLDFDPASCTPIGFNRSAQGFMRLWLPMLTAGGSPPPGDYVFGADVAAGTGASNSCLVGFERGTGEQVLEFASPDIRPDEFGRLAVAICRWFRSEELHVARLIWEAPGPGRNFGDTVVESGFRNFYYREANEQSIVRKSTQTIGWYPTKDNKRGAMGRYREDLYKRAIGVRSKVQIEECQEFIYTSTGWILHTSAVNTNDPSGAGENHGDRPTAAALAWKECHSVRRLMASDGSEVTDKQRIPVGSLAWRRARANREARAAADGKWAV